MMKRKNISDQLFEVLKKKIETQVWSPGDYIPSESQLTKEYSVSRSSVRDAIQSLVSMGWLEKNQGKRTIVKEKKFNDIISTESLNVSLNIEELIKVVEFRKLIEVESARLAAKNANSKNLKNLKNILNKMSKEKGDSIKFSQLDFLFHIELAKASQNDLFVKTIELLKNTLINNVKNNNIITNEKSRMDFHKSIFKAIESKDEKAAKIAMRAHMNFNLKELKKIL